MKDVTVKNNDQTIYDVIISGAGPVGLFLACELALARCSVLVLEKTESPGSALKRLPFGIRGLSAPTIEALDRRGLLNDLELHKRLKNPHKITTPAAGPRRQAGHFAGIPFHDGDIDSSKWEYRLPSSNATSLISEIEELESVLCRRAKDLGVVIKRGLAVTSFSQNAQGVKVQTMARVGSQAGTDVEERNFNSLWLVGCDGSRSVVRKNGGFLFEGTEPEFTGYSMQVELPDSEKLKPGRNVTPAGMYFQSQPGYLLIQDFDLGAFHRSKQKITLEHVQQVLRRISNTDVTINTLHVATTWTDRARQATTYRNGRVLLAGDAAHIHSPLGGQGLNLGLGDAMNLGWKLATTIHGQAPQGLLDSYQTERHPIGAEVLNWSRAQVAIMKPEPGALALYAIVRDLINTRDGATYFAAKVWGIHARYALEGEHPLVGRSVPNFEFEDGVRMAELMREGRGVLLDFNLSPSIKTLAAACGERIKYVSGRAQEQFGLSAAFIRPDGVIAWVAEQEVDLVAAEAAITRWIHPLDSTDGFNRLNRGDKPKA